MKIGCNCSSAVDCSKYGQIFGLIKQMRIINSIDNKRRLLRNMRNHWKYNLNDFPKSWFLMNPSSVKWWLMSRSGTPIDCVCVLIVWRSFGRIPFYLVCPAAFALLWPSDQLNQPTSQSQPNFYSLHTGVKIFFFFTKWREIFY